MQYHRGDRRVFEYPDPDPYTSGHFAFRTVHSHLKIRHFRVYRLAPAPRNPRD